MPEPTTETLFDGKRLSFADRDGDAVWFTKRDGCLIVEAEPELYIELTKEQVAALRQWLTN